MRITAIRVIVSVVVIVTVWESESKAVPEVAIAETTTIMVVESAATETTIPVAAGHPGTEAAALEAATAETATSVAPATTATRQRHCRHNQADGGDRQ